MTNPPAFEELCQTGRDKLKAGQLQEALRAFEQARQLNDLDADVHEGLATIHFMLKTFESAVKHFERVTRLDPRRGAAWINLGAAYNRMGNHQMAAEVLRRAVQIEKKSAIGYYNLGIAYKNLKQWNLAVPAYREALRMEPRMADGHLNLANVYTEINNFPQAITHYKKALELQPGLERAARGLERAVERLEARKKEISPFGRLVNADVTENTGTAANAVYRELNDKEREADRRKVHDLMTKAETELQELLAAMAGDLDSAVRTLNKMLTQALSPHGVSITKAEALEDFVEARTTYAPRLAHFQETMRQLREHEANFK
jgi:tetratricopeptide (TPR) repeat protein